jgi:hypothetical protein
MAALALEFSIGPRDWIIPGGLIVEDVGNAALGLDSRRCAWRRALQLPLGAVTGSAERPRNGLVADAHST